MTLTETACVNRNKNRKDRYFTRVNLHTKQPSCAARKKRPAPLMKKKKGHLTIN